MYIHLRQLWVFITTENASLARFNYSLNIDFDIDIIGCQYWSPIIPSVKIIIGGRGTSSLSRVKVGME